MRPRRYFSAKPYGDAEAWAVVETDHLGKPIALVSIHATRVQAARRRAQLAHHEFHAQHRSIE